MSWTAIIPLKAPQAQKTRLSGTLAPADRAELVRQMFIHVTGILAAHPRITRTLVLSPTRPGGWDGSLIIDRKRGLNSELEDVKLQMGGHQLLFLHADLPLLQLENVNALLEGADRAGCAIASNRDNKGTNAIALNGQKLFRFQFGQGSLRRHVRQAPNAVMVRQEGLMMDIDTPSDLAAARERGFSFGAPPHPPARDEF